MSSNHIRGKVFGNIVKDTTSAVSSVATEAAKKVSNTIKSIVPKESSIKQTANPLSGAPNQMGGKNKKRKTKRRIKRNRRTYRRKP